MCEHAPEPDMSVMYTIDFRGNGKKPIDRSVMQSDGLFSYSSLNELLNILLASLTKYIVGDRRVC